MVYIKSLMAGVVAVVLGVPAIAVTLVVALVTFHRPHGTGYSVDSRSLIGTWPFNWSFWLLIAFLFALGFSWEFRRASR